VAIIRSRTLRALRNILNDALYRGSLILLVNTLATAGIGFLFWTLAARSYPAATVGIFSSVTSGVGLLAAIAALGLPNTMIRYVVSTDNPRELLVASVTAIATVGTALCLAAVLILGPYLPPALHLHQRGGMVLFVAALVGFTAVGGTIDAGLIATRSSHAVLIKNLLGSTVKVAALLLLVNLRSSGLLISYGLGLLLATLLSSIVLFRKLRGRAGFRSFRVLRQFLSKTSGNYLATVMGILPVSVVPIEVLVIRGAAETARFAVAFLIAGFLNFIPSTVAQVLFAEASHQGVTLGTQLRKAVRGVYALLIPALLVVVPAAPLLLRLFGTAYATAATGCLRILALSALLTGGTYLVDSLLIARDRTRAYVFMNGANAALVLGCVGILLPHGLTAAAAGWALAQGLSLVLGLLVLATGTIGRHHTRVDPRPLEKTSPEPQGHPQPRNYIYAFEPQIRELLATWPMMPTTLIAERIGWDQSIPILLDRVTELRLAFSDSQHRSSPALYMPGEIAQCGLWFPPVEVPVGSGPARSARQLAVVTMITGYSRWLSAMLIPSRHPNDLLTGLWELLEKLGAIPRVLTWDNDGAVSRWREGKVEITDEYREFSDLLGVKTVIGVPSDTMTRGLIELAHADLEHSFLPSREFDSPTDFNLQLGNWLDTANARQPRPPGQPPAELVSTDRREMLPLPLVRPRTEWHLPVQVGRRPFVHFDFNDYSVPSALAGHRVELVADLKQVRVLYNGNVAAEHDRAWTRERAICDPAHSPDGYLTPRKP